MNITALSAANFAFQTADIKKGERVLLAGDVVPLLDAFQPVAPQVTCLVSDIALVDQLRARGFRALRASLVTTGHVVAVMPLGDLGSEGEWTGGYEWRGKPAAVWVSEVRNG